jgi:hypothetical protein
MIQYIIFFHLNFKSKFTLVFGASKVVKLCTVFCVDPRIVGILY